MTIQETAMLLAYLREFFPNGKPVTETTVQAWQELFSDYPFELVKACAKNVVRTYDGVTMPPPAVILSEVDKLHQDDTEIELWRIAEKWIKRGSVMKQEDFDKLPKPIQRYFGGVSGFRDLGMLEQDQLPNERARFLRQIGTLVESERALQALPQEVRGQVELLAEKLGD